MKQKDHKHLSEIELIALAKKDKSYFGALYELYFEPIYRFTFKRLGGDEDAAADVTQLTFMKAMVHIEQYEDRGFAFKSWLYRIAQNEVNMHFRKEQKTKHVSIEKRHISEICQEAQLGRYMSIEEQERLVQLLNEMEEEALDLIELRFFQEMSFKEIAAIYNISEANAKMRVYRILVRLHKKWEQGS
jgi:RNA polymerase sigma-70 factor (ECF subfamily)